MSQTILSNPLWLRPNWHMNRPSIFTEGLLHEAGISRFHALATIRFKTSDDVTEMFYRAAQDQHTGI